MASFLALCQAQKTTLELNLITGQKFHTKTESSFTFYQHRENDTPSYTMEVNRAMRFEVLSEDDSSYEMEFRFDSLTLKIGETTDYEFFSSEKKPTNDAYSKILYNMKDQPFQITMSKTGRIRDIRNMDSLIENAFHKDLDITEAELPGVKELILYWFDKEDFRTSIEIALACYPDRPVSIGESWEIENEIKTTEPIIRTTVYTFAQSKGKYYTIVGESSIQTKKEEIFTESVVASQALDMKGKMNSTLKLNKKSGIVEEAHIDQKMSGDVYVDEEKKMPMTIKVRTKFTCK